MVDNVETWSNVKIVPQHSFAIKREKKIEEKNIILRTGQLLQGDLTKSGTVLQIGQYIGKMKCGKI